MEEKKNPEFKRTIGGTIAAGMKSVFNAKGKKYYTIEYKDDTRFHKRGEQQRIIVDEAFIGRDAKCQIRFDDSFPTVSREHAVIVREGENWKLVHHSQTNSTFVNGMEVTTEQMLQNGDEIQISENGPRLVFITSDTAYVNNIGVAERLNMFGQQSLRPYKIALICISVAFLLAIAGLVTYLVMANSGPNIDKLEDDVYCVRMTEFTLTSPGVNDGEPFTFVFEDNDFKEPSATGFMTSDNRFITARHVIEPWFYENCWDNFNGNNPFCYVNMILTCLGGKVNATFEADSKNGKHLTFKTSDCTVSEYEYEEVPVDDKSGMYGDVKIRRILSNDDYAYVRRDVSSNLQVNNELSEKLKMGAKLDILGFPSSLGAKKNNIQPQYRSVITSNNGLLDGKIVTNNAMDYGSSGSPVFSRRFGKYYVVGIVSSTIGQNGGVIIPISKVK